MNSYKYMWPQFNFIEENKQTGYIKSNNIKIISINIGESIYNKIESIKNLINKESPKILCLLETHTYYEEYKRIKRYLENNQYKVLFIAKSQKEYYDKIKKQEIKNIQDNDKLTIREKEKEIYNWESNAYLYKNKYAGGVILLIKREIQDMFEEVNMIPDKRGITLLGKYMISTLEIKIKNILKYHIMIVQKHINI